MIIINRNCTLFSSCLNVNVSKNGKKWVSVRVEGGKMKMPANGPAFWLSRQVSLTSFRFTQTVRVNFSTFRNKNSR